MVNALCAFTIIAVLAGTQSGTSLAEFRTFRCRFSAGVEAKDPTVDGKVARQAAKGFNDEIVFDAVDLSKGTARMIGNAGGDDVVATGTETAITFFEPTGAGAVMTSIFNVRGGPAVNLGSGPFRAVMSRHLNLSQAGLAISQYDGLCLALR
jgi:hypothetical protein